MHRTTDHTTKELTMMSKTTTLLLASTLAVAASTAFAGSSHCHGRYCNGNAARVHYRENYDSWSEWRYRRLYHQRNGYYPDYRGCFPGVCRDNPYY
jgi:hypothetical protein